MFVEVILALLLLSSLVFFVPKAMRWYVAMGVVMAGAVAGVGVAVPAMEGAGELTLVFGKSVVFGLQSVRVDALSAFFILLISAAMLSVMIYARGYLKKCAEQKPPMQVTLHYFCLLVMYLSMLLVVVFRDGFGFLFFWELMTLSSFVLVLFDGEKREVRRAAMNYLIMMHIGFFALLIGFVTLAQNGLPASFDSLSIYFGRGEVIPLFVLFLVGFGMKAGLFPLHVWVPEADPAAPPYVAALMSAVTCKMGIYGVLRVVSQIETELFTVGVVLLTVGLLTALWGAILAALQHDMKKILAYSSIENIGIICVGMGVGLLGKSQGNTLLTLCGIGGALLHVLNHSFFKTLLFLGTGNVFWATGTTHLNDLGGLGRRMPLTSILFLVAVLAASALPPLGGFVSEFMIYLGLLDGIAVNGPLTILSLFGLAFLSLIGGIVLLALTKLYSVVFLGQERKPMDHKSLHEVSSSMLIAMALPLTGILLVGFFPFVFVRWIFSVAGATLRIPNWEQLYGVLWGSFLTLSYVLATLVGLVVVLWVIRRLVTRSRPVASSPTWSCAFTAPTSRMQYSGESFSEGLERISGRIMHNTGETAHLQTEEIFPARHQFEVKHKDKIDTLFTAWWVAVLRRINARFAVLRTGKINHYILYAMLFLVLVFVLSLLNLL